MKKILFITILFPLTLWATPNVPIVSYEHCSVPSSDDTMTMGQPTSGTLRHRLSLYDKNLTRAQRGLCTYAIFFEFHDRTITLASPLTIPNHLHEDRTTTPPVPLSGVDIDGYGSGGDDDLLRITIDARAVTTTPRHCAFMLPGGFAAKHNIRGLTIMATQADRAICDENGIDLYHALSPNCDDRMPHQAFEHGCDFQDTTIVTPPVASSSKHRFDITFVDYIDPSVITMLPTYTSGGHSGTVGSGGMMGTGGTPLGTGGINAAGGNTGSGGQSGSGGFSSGGSGGMQTGTGGMIGTGGSDNTGGTSGFGGYGGSGGLSGSSGSAGSVPAPARSGREPDPFGCNLVKPTIP